MNLINKINNGSRVKDLIISYYSSNPSSFNFETYHNKANEFSEYHVTQDRKKLTIYNSGIVHRFKPEMFSDDTNEAYELIEFKENNYLINSQRAIPCSRVYKNIYGNFFICPFIIPNGELIIFGGNLDNQVFSDDITFYDKFFENIRDKEIFSKYISNMSLSFRDNTWWNKENIVFKRFINYKKFPNIYERIDQLRKVCAYSFLELILLVHTNKIEFDLNEFLYIIFESKNYSGHKTFLKLKDYLSLTETSSQIIQNTELMDYFISNCKTWNDFKHFFELDDFLASIDFSKIDMTTMMDFEIGHTLNIHDQVIRKSLNNIRNKFRTLENEFRVKKGFKIVGSFTQESILYQKLKNHFKDLKIISQGSPSWIKPQRLDIYFPDVNIAIEYQGVQHFRAVDYFGGEEGYLLTKQRDLIKLRKCKRNGCKLFEVLPDYDFPELVNQIENHIKTI